MKKKYMIIFYMAILGLIFFLSWLLSQNQADISVQSIADIPQKVKIRFSSSWGGYDTKAAKIQQVLNNFEKKHPHTDIINESMSGEEFLFTLKTDFASGNDPDVFGLWPGSDFKLLVENEKIADLTDVIKEDLGWFERFGKDAWKYVTVDDKIYGLPFEIIYEGLFINTSIFTEYDIKIPTTFDELLNAVDILKENDMIPIAYNNSPEGSYIYQNMVMKLGGKEDTENPFDADGAIKQCYIDAMYYMKTLYDAGAFPEDAFIMDDKSRNDLFINKKAAMIVQGAWFIGDKGLSPYDSTVDIVGFPNMDGGKSHDSAIIYGCGNGIFHMSQKAWEDDQKREVGIALLRELTSIETVKKITEHSGIISNIYLPENMQHSQSKLYQKGVDLVNASKELIGPPDSFIERGIWDDIIVKQMPRVLEGEVTPEEVFDRVQKEHLSNQ
ncbi:extracellular solute-binding protein [Vallitalea pronyensis]|uniref:Extracellular solute-binding protein n=1 Tax=Vallitalea pronyensis TaxID=1348613 RepID=A0A8J8MNZ8_9FIRM|nr:extracellular solute-binding protein [Vallitalea pronyensis]QUI24713.1 extracellular solute-binding protein [Vallitalea pronyensis]